MNLPEKTTTVPTCQKPRIEAATLVPIYRHQDGEIRLVLIRRSKGGIHGGQLAFPGGKREPQDHSMLAAALREAWEEIGLAPGRVDVLASLPVAETRTTGFRIFPFLARIIPPRQWLRDEREIAEIITVRLGDLARPEVRGEEIRQLPHWPAPVATPYYRVGSHKVWGVTYRILHPLIPRLLAGELIGLEIRPESERRLPHERGRL
jgi:8-oxo-dGTP pyrophosphatase MutT (NUDIX family)